MASLLRPLALMVAIFFATPVLAGVQLEWRFAEKDRFFFEVRSFTAMTQRTGSNYLDEQVEMHVVADVEVAKVEATQVVLRTRVLTAKPSMMTPRPDPFRFLEGAEIHMVLDPGMKMTRVDGLEPVADAILRAEGRTPTPEGRTGLTKFMTTYVRGWCESVFPPLPGRKVGPDDAWKQEATNYAFAQNQERTYTYGSALKSSQRHRIEVTGRHGGTRDSKSAEGPKVEVPTDRFTGTYVFDAKLGRVVQGETSWRLVTRAQLPASPGGQAYSCVREVHEHVQTRICATEPRPTDAPSDIVAVAHETDWLDEMPKAWTNSVGMQFDKIPAGTFTMGSKEFGRPETERPWEVTISRPFFMGIHEVRIGDFKKFVAATGFKTHKELTREAAPAAEKLKGAPGIDPKAEFTWRSPGWKVDDRHPAVWLTRGDAKAYCAWLSKQENKPYRLPTEAEWEYACRAGTTTTYYTGDEPEGLAKIANIMDTSAKAVFPQFVASRQDDGYPFTAPVGSFAPNAFGLYDMFGNAAEWCEDWLFLYPGGSGRDPIGPPGGSHRIHRGGGFPESPHQIGAGIRMPAPNRHFNLSSGFRVVLSTRLVPQEPPKPTWIGAIVMPRDPDRVSLHRDGPTPYWLPAFRVIDERLGGLTLRDPTTGQARVEEKDSAAPAAEALSIYSRKLDTVVTPLNYILRAGAYKALGENAKALADLDRAIELDDHDAWLFHLRARLRLESNQWAGALRDFDKAVELRAKHPALLNSLAWQLATCPDASVRNGKRAVELADQLLEVTRRQDPNSLDTAAAARAEAGDWEQAVELQTRANHLYQAMFCQTEAHRQRLESYRNQQPYRQKVAGDR